MNVASLCLVLLAALASPSLHAQSPGSAPTPFERLQLEDPTATPLPAASTTPGPQETVSSLAPDVKLSPRSQPLPQVFAPADQALGSTQLIVYFGILIALVIGGIYLIKRGLPLRAGRAGEQQLKILETKMLGNRQFLLVVAYQDARMLIGVSPGQVQYLTPLDLDLPETAEMINLATIPQSKIAKENEL